MRYLWLAGIILISVVSLSCQEEEKPAEETQPVQEEKSEQPAPSQNDTASNSISAIGMTVEWEIDGQNLSMTLEAPAEGWIAIGFHPSRMMKDANMIIGYIENGEVMIQDHFGTGTTRHRSDLDLGGTDDITGVDGSEQGGSTSLSFSIPLDSGDTYDQPIVPGEETDVILAYGDRDSFGDHHSERTSISITF